MTDYVEKAKDIVADFDYDRPYHEGGNDLDWESAARDIAQALKKARNDGLEEAAAVAAAHRGSAAKKRLGRGMPLGSMQNDFERESITSEERGEDIAAEMIAAAIRERKT